MSSENLAQVEAAVHLEQAYAREEKGEYADALSECDAAIDLARAFLADAYNLRGIVLEALGRSKEALGAYRMAVQLQPGFQQATDNLSELETELGLREPVTVARFGGVGEAHIARGRLEAEGIWSFVAEAPTIGQPGGIRLQVQASDVERALEILGIEEEEEGVRCPNCDSWDVRIPILGTEWRCKECGHRWTL